MTSCYTSLGLLSLSLSKVAYLFLRIACHSLWPISHLHTIPLEVYLLVLFPFLPLLQLLMLLRHLVLLLLTLMFLYRLLRMTQTFDIYWIMSWPFKRFMDRFWWTCSMRFVDCAQSWHSFDDLHHHLLLMIDFDCPLAFRHKKGEYIFAYLSTKFCFQRKNIFVDWSLWSLDCI